MLIIYLMIGLFILLNIYVLLKSILLRYGRYEYSVREDQNVIFDEKLWYGLKVINASDHTYEIQGAVGTGAVLINIEVSSNISGYYFEPYILVTSGNMSIRQYFEYGCKGRRVLNITHIIEGKEKQVFTLKGKHLSIPSVDKMAQICGYSMDESASIMVIAPHPDDAEIAAFGLYSKNAERSTVITVTAGEGGKAVTAGIDDMGEYYHEMVYKTRLIDSIAVPLMAGVNKNNIHNLGYFDGTLSLMYEKRNTRDKVSSYYVKDLYVDKYHAMNLSSIINDKEGNSEWDTLVNKLTTALDVYKPDVIVAPFPAIDNHSDHEFTTRALYHSIRRSGIKQGKLFLYANLYTNANSFPFGKRGSTVSIPPMIPEGIRIQHVYSLHTPPDVQKSKAIALEMMSDLRMNIYELSFGQVFRYLITLIKQNIYNSNNSFFRRALMNNEMFFVYDIGIVHDSGWDESIFGQYSKS
jgi:LmbE family N-acetylglucosaminyl deacetylase